MSPLLKRRNFIALLGSTAVWPTALYAQQPAPLVGFMSSRSPEDSVRLLEAFRNGLRENGFVEGQNVAVAYRWARGAYDRLPALAAELIGLRVAVLVAVGGEVSALAARAATSTLPIVFGMGSDPVKAGLVASLNRPGGNATGVNILTAQLESKRLGLLNELIPGAAPLGALVNPNFRPSIDQSQEIRNAAQALGRPVILLYASTDAELDAAFAAFAQQQAAGLLVAADAFFDSRGGLIAAAAARGRLPAIYQFRHFADLGGLMSYGVSLTDAYRHFGAYTARILKGTPPADLPVMQSVKFEFIINLKTAKALGLEIPPTLLARADEVIE